MNIFMNIIRNMLHVQIKQKLKHFYIPSKKILKNIENNFRIFVNKMVSNMLKKYFTNFENIN